MKFKHFFRIGLLVLFILLLALTLISIFGQPRSSKKIDLGTLSSVQNDVKMTAKIEYDPEKKHLLVDATVETYQMPELIGESYFSDIFLSNESGYTYPEISNHTEVLSDYQVKGKFVFNYVEPAQILKLHLFDLEERIFNFKVPPSVPDPNQK